MGKWKKAWKSVTSPFKAAKNIIKNIKKPFSKITKGIARGIAKIAKVVMRGVGQLNKKLGPIGMIGLSENTWLTGNTIRVDGGEDITG